VRSAEEILNEPFDFPFLDINETNGETFRIARMLLKKGVPFAFVSAALRWACPESSGRAPYSKAIFARNLKKPIGHRVEVKQTCETTTISNLQRRLMAK
jgi:hypothetical protein